MAVFTDVDCGYCRKLHMEMDEINALGIEVRYLAFPRAGPGSRSYEKIVSAWCAKDAQQAITELKMGRSIPDRSCANPVMEQYALGQAMGVDRDAGNRHRRGHLVARLSASGRAGGGPGFVSRPPQPSIGCA